MTNEMPKEILAFKNQQGETVFSADERLKGSNATHYLRADQVPAQDRSLYAACGNFFDSWFIGSENGQEDRKEFADLLFRFVRIWQMDAFTAPSDAGLSNAIEIAKLNLKDPLTHDLPDSVLETLIRAATKPAVPREVVEAFGELLELQDSALSLDIRAERINAPEDAEIKLLCERFGYGAVMDSAARQWHNHPTAPKGGAHTVYHCYSVVKSVTDRAKQALAILTKETADGR